MRRGFTAILILVVVLVMGVGIVYYLQTFKINKQDLSVNTQKITNNSPSLYIPCSKEKFLSNEEYLPTYIVKKGDTLLSISQSRLKSNSRIGELISLNKEKYPNLSLQTPFIEQGWKLILPPENSEFTNGQISVIAGRLRVDNDGWWVTWYATQQGPYNTKYLPSTFSTGDCVIVVHQGTGSNWTDEQKVFSVAKQ